MKPERGGVSVPDANQAGRGVTVLYRPLAELRLSPRNPRLHSKTQVRQIARSIEAFGFNVPILIDRDLNVIAGHGRILACRLLGFSEAPTILLEHLTAAQARAFMLADNKLTDNSIWNDRLLGEQLKELAELELDFSLEATGFSMGEIDLRIEGLNCAADAELDPADEVLPTAGPAISQRGDVWLLGEHRLCCGDALDQAAYEALLQGGEATAVITDPPYNVAINGHVSGRGAIQHREFIQGAGEMNEAEFTGFLTRVCSLLARHSADGALVYIFMDWRHLGELLAAGRAAFGDLKNLCVWVKGSGGMGSFYRSEHELIFVFKHGSGPHRNNVQLGQFGRNRTNVWRYPGASTFARGGDSDLSAQHPTPKPVAMIADAILDCTARGDIVLDGFVGAGATILAAERTGRRGFGLELDPLFVDLSIRRWQRLTGASARHGVSGRSFDQLAAERRSGDADQQ